ncbi:hypothetical protein EN866_33395 [Mesorhizobium sp. M2D.F.Ca.ET.223.01.1.1]|uniref:hypothetical protein n=1 Tax=Mesorhizobium sp. M2D.F.Ca.ET.223.01.1.1 TaxID=2563940 RepID=UPI001091E9FE|nr:hypothetical protein [Mesorhizobium sp. M2D.F.Ca.ET.223.01.1.1]TGR84273.1 hypothetical protein EN866_33395 [Mesorhizobium sp. M2D.F.Ca.ET.223.01.1.1]TGT65323.1 hypothetical protein EN802_32100 [bacterium M00.F.Ca.ET.159.01.1.1]TGT79434.1 hypothetical protein EN800_31440 [bacterium M00.F.Ca.ET.157.01.1.1]
MIKRDASDWNRMDYEQAVAWIIQNADTAWVDGGKLSARAITIAGLFKKSPETLREDVRAASRLSRQ